MRFAVLARLIDSRLHPIAQNIPFELSEHSQHAGERSATRGCEVKRFAQ